MKPKIKTQLPGPKSEIIIKKIRKLGYNAAETHFNPNGIRSDIDLEKLVKVINITQ